MEKHKEEKHGWTGQTSKCDFAGWCDCSFFCNKLSNKEKKMIACKYDIPDFSKCILNKDVKREYIQINQKEMRTLKEILEGCDIKLGDKCYYCKDKIKDTDKFGIWNKPDRLVCNNILCVTQAISEDDDI